MSEKGAAVIPLGPGRIFWPDPRDQNYPLEDLNRSVARATRTSLKVPVKYHNVPKGPRLDQGPHPSCVGFGWTNLRRVGPITASKELPKFDAKYAYQLYKRAQREFDPWPGENYEGTTVRAGAEALMAEGYVESYWWAWDVPTILSALSWTPVVMGTDWFAGMDEPTVKRVKGRDVAEWTAAGAYYGGHCWLLTGKNEKAGTVRALNSHRDNFEAVLSFDALEYLMSQSGEACVAVEIPLAKKLGRV
jgi:hypothetical protein